MNAEEALQLIAPPRPDEMLEEKEKTEVVGEMLDSLTPREARVLRMRFGIGCEEHTLEEIGKKLDVTRERVRQMEIQALRKMKHPSRMVELWSVKE
jgi:RNA polymerase primary sigma factor